MFPGKQIKVSDKVFDKVSGRDSMGDLLYHKDSKSELSVLHADSLSGIGGGMDRNQLFLELKNIQGRGITIFLEGEKSTPETVASQLCVQEDNCSYMRDYVYDEGVLTELHFDKVRCK